MKVIEELSLYQFRAWAGAEENLAALTTEGCNQLEAVIEDCYPEGIDATTLNDILRFDFNWCAHSVGYRNEEAARNNDRDSYAEHYEKALAEKFPAYADYVADYVADYLDDLTDEDENEDRSEDRDDEAGDSFYYYLKDNPEIAGAALADIISDREGGDEAQAYLLLGGFSDGEKGEKGENALTPEDFEGWSGKGEKGENALTPEDFEGWSEKGEKGENALTPEDFEGWSEKGEKGENALTPEDFEGWSEKGKNI